MANPIASYLAHVKTRVWDFLVKRYGPWPILGLALALGGAVATLFFETWAASQWQDLRTGWDALMRQPVGFWGLVVFFLLAGFVVLSFADTSPTVNALKAWLSKGEKVRPVPLSAHDKDAIARIRNLWYHEQGQDSTLVMFRLFDEATEALKGHYYTKLFTPVKDDFQKAIVELETALDIAKAVPLDAVIGAFNNLFAQYLRGAELLYQIHQNDLSLFSPPFLKPFHQFRECHKVFGEKLVLATNYPGINRRLKVFAMPGMALDSRKFLGEQPWDGEQPPPPPLPLKK